MADNRKRKRRRRRRRRRNFAPLIIIIVIVAAVAVLSVFNVKKQKKILSGETNKLIAMDIYHDNVDMEIYSSGNFGQQEEVIKNYISDYIETFRRVANFKNDETLMKMLGAENLSSDGPGFEKSIQYIEGKRSELSGLCDKLKSMSKKETMAAAYEKTGFDSFFRKIFEEQMFEGITSAYFYSDESVDAAAKELNSYLDYKLSVLNFLKEHAEEWQIVDGAIQFKNAELLEQYNQLTA